MALSDKERERRYNVIHTMQSIYDNDVVGEENIPTPAVVVDEAADSRMKNLDDIQLFIEGKKLPYMESESLSPLRGDLGISVFFMSTQSKQVDPNDNLLRFNINLGDGYSQAEPVSEHKCSLEKFIGLPKKMDSPDFKSVKDITKLCNAPEIYNTYKQSALDIIRTKMPAAYSMFTGGSISHYQVSVGDMWWSKYNIRTLAVTYDKRFNKFLYLYHPEFVFECSLDEWTLNRNRYKSLRDCYCYTLAFLITHEMMHLIHHNTTSTINMEDVGGHQIVNIMQDSFINCQISRVFTGVKGTRSDNGLAPMPRLGVGSSITVRAEHNRGFKPYKTFKDLATEVLSVISKMTKVAEYSTNASIYSESKDLSKYSGADVFITVDVSPRASSMRSNSAIFQRMTNELIKTITDGRVYEQYSKLSDAEKESDKPVLSNGTLVQVKGSSVICSVQGYDEGTKEYDLQKTEISDVIRTDMGDGNVLCTPVHTPIDAFGKRRRMDIRPYNPEDNTWIEASGEREKKTELTDKELETLSVGNTEEGSNIIDIAIETYGEDLIHTVIKSVIENSNVSTTFSDASDVIKAVKGKSDAECKQILGNDMYNKISDLLDRVKNIMGNSPQPEQPQQPQKDNSPVYHIGDIVWVRRKRAFGKIVSINNGQFELEEMKEIGVRVLDDSSYHQVQEGMSFVSEDGTPKMVLKERVFAPTGRKLGVFTSMDLETFDIEYTESTEKQQESSQGTSQGKPSSVPKPKDDNPITPEDDKNSKKDDTSQNNDQSSSSGGDSDNKQSEEEEEGDIPDEWDINGQDLDDEEPPEDGDGGEGDSYTSGDSDPGMSSGSDGSDDSGETDDLEELEQSASSGGGSSSDDSGDSNGDDSGSSGGSGDGSSDDTDSEEDEDDLDNPSGDGDGSGDSSDDEDNDDNSSDSKSNKNNPKEDSGDDTSQNNDQSSSSGGDSSDGGQQGDSSGGSDGGDADYSDVDDDWDDDDSGAYSQSDLEKALNEIESSESESSKERRSNENEREEEARNQQKQQDNKISQTNPDEVKAAKDMLGKAIKDTRNQQPSSDDNDSRRYSNDDIDENDILGSMGAGSLTSTFVPKMASDWKAKLEKLLDQALGYDIITNPNLFNKKLEDAPPGREDEVPDIKSIAVLLDCSGSMGAREFAQVIKHLDTMFMVRKMDKTTFHIIDWGDNRVQSVSSTYIRVKGRMFKREIMKHTDHGWGTALIPGLMVASQKVHKPDAILILTDAEIYDGDRMGRTAEGKIAQEFIKKYKKKIIWVLTADGAVSRVGAFDPTAQAQKRIIKFRK
jgi:hypothetical protein